MTISNHTPLAEPLILELEENPFAEYMWMENEEEFDRQVEEELWEQDFIESCFNQMLEEEQWEWFIPSRDLPQDSAPYSQTEGHSAPYSQTEGHSAPYSQTEGHSAPYSQTEGHSAPYSQTEGHSAPYSQTEGHSAPWAADILVQSRLNPNAKEFTPGIQSHVM